MDVVVKLKPDDLKEIVDKYFYIADDLKVKSIKYVIKEDYPGMGNPPNDPYLQEIICTCEKIK